jgi:hypothetical protein
MTEPFFSVLRLKHLASKDIGDGSIALLPLGMVVATCDLVRVVRTNELTHFQLDSKERAFGDYSPGRYAWLLENIHALPEPIPAKGSLGLWEWEGYS